MIKVLIVDDEFRVCQLICNLIDWGSLDMQIIGVAHNGIEARELARETVPDLVITDISLFKFFFYSKLNGLSLQFRFCENGCKKRGSSSALLISQGVSGTRGFCVLPPAILFGLASKFSIHLGRFHRQG